jgi:hypothetical protein
MDVTTKCPKCGLLLALDTADGDEFECPQCGQRLTVQTTAAKAKPTKRPPPRRTASSDAPPASHVDDIDWSIPEIPQQILRRKKRRAVGVDPAVVTSGIIVAVCIIALVIGGIYFAKRRSSFAGLGRDSRATMSAFAADDWETQAYFRFGALQRHAHRNSLLLGNLVPDNAKQHLSEDLDEVMICDGVGRSIVITSLRDLPSAEEFRKRGGAVEPYRGHEILRVAGSSFSRASDRAIALADSDAVMRRMIDASFGTPASADPPNDYMAFFRIRTRAVKLRAAIPPWMALFDSLGVSIRLERDGSAVLFLFGEASSEASAKEAVPQIERVKQDFRAQLEGVRTLYRGAIGDLDKLSAAIASNSVVQEGNRVGVRCVASADLFPALVQAQLGSFRGTPSASPPPTSPSPPVASAPPPPKKEPAKSGLPPFHGSVADHAQQTQDNLSAQFGRQRTVMIVGAGFAQGAEQNKLADDLTELVKRVFVGNNAVNYNTIQSGGWVACVFAPIDDLDELARRIDFAKVEQVNAEQRRIFLTPKR